MDDRKRKPTLTQIRSILPFDAPHLAEKAGVPIQVVYHALLMHPIYEEGAKKILIALSDILNLQLSLENVDIVVWEDYQVLWIIRASANQQQSDQAALTDEYNLIYAKNQEHAAVLASHWFDDLSHLPHHYFTPCPEGFQIGCITLPGRRMSYCN